ncbi:MAG: hypothetical protein LQ347_001381 [Umbilicaria vellea]|nr:MAG: hypothetical protein LQ347_001381 [Umbilicaria vellea]
MPDPPSSTFFSPDTAFRESLFDALADDEGADFWEGVYGQPIHNYPSQHATGPTGELEKMTEEEYVTFVRGRMWEKSHGYILEERARREEERKQRADRIKVEERMRRDKAASSARVEASLKRRVAIKKAKRWVGVWEGYVKAWDALRNNAESSDEEKERKPIRDRIEWPVESGLYKDVGKEAVETFYMNAPRPAREGEGVDLLAVLKVERVRWHPDKIQQRFGGLGLDQETVKMVTAVFQVVDRMWSDAREKQGNQGPGP